MYKKIFLFLICVNVLSSSFAQTPQPVRQLLNADYMKGATFSLVVKNRTTGEVVYSYDEHREVIPASVLKTVTTATALELLGEDYRFPTTLEYTGEIAHGVLKGDLYIKGSGDPSLGSAHCVGDRNSFTLEQATFINQWIESLKKAGINRIDGRIIADETVFDTEGISPKWLQEDIGSYYGAGSYGLNIFDNLYHLHLTSGSTGETPRITGTEPEISSLHFHNYLKAATVQADSAFIIGGPYSNERYLYGVIPVNQKHRVIKGDIPDPPLFLAQYLKKRMEQAGIPVEKEATSIRNLGKDPGQDKEKKQITTTYSPTLQELVRITNERSHNLYADALFKTIGSAYQPKREEFLSSFGKGIKVTTSFWEEKGLNPSSLQITDGSGLAVTNKVSARFITDMLVYMATNSPASEAFIGSFPLAGQEGTVRNFLKGTFLEGKARLKSGGMSRVRSYAGYINKDGEEYAIALFVNHYNCEGREIIRALERLLVALFRKHSA